MSLELLAAATALPVRRVPWRGGRRCAAPFDQDAVTLAAEAVLALHKQSDARPAALLLATVSPPYEEGGNAQLVAELTGLGESLFCAELTATPRDGLAALRLADGLVAAGGGPVIVCAAHRARRSGERDAGDGAVALLVDRDGGVATLTPGPAHAEELRDRWRRSGDAEPREADPSFADELGAPRVAALVAAACARPAPAVVGVGEAGPVADRELQAAICVGSARAGARAERALGGPGDRAVASTGLLGAAHPLLRVALAGDRPTVVVVASGGLGEATIVTPGEGAAELASALQAQVDGGREADSAPGDPAQVGFDPYASAPRAWRERAQDLRLEGVVHDGRVLFPPPAGVDGPRRGLARRGRVITWTRDHVYPGADTVDMAVVALADGNRFYGQVAADDEVAIDDEVTLVPRRLHDGGGVVQYFWKVASCR
ncbi:MAG TPA: hypothetical protein VFW09_04270 [Solirubrobacteraceae bacterium]|nr:hypothetical protein [Solirubrobacteraceae bacterium]